MGNILVCYKITVNHNTQGFIHLILTINTTADINNIGLLTQFYLNCSLNMELLSLQTNQIILAYYTYGILFQENIFYVINFERNLFK